MPSSLIHKLIFEIELNCPENEAKETSNRLFDKHITFALERVLTRFSEEDITIDTPIEIELGSVSEEKMAYSLENKLLKELQKYVRGTAIPTSYNKRRSSISELFFSYIQFPLIPWDITAPEEFNIECISQKGVEEIVVSDKLTEKLIALISDKLETFNRFLDLTFRLDRFPDLIKKIVSKLPISNATIYRELIDRISSKETNSSLFFKSITHYLLYNLLFSMKMGVEKNLTLINTLSAEREAPVIDRQTKADIDSSIFKEKNGKLLIRLIEQVLNTTSQSPYDLSLLEAIVNTIEAQGLNEAALILKTLKKLEKNSQSLELTTEETLDDISDESKAVPQSRIKPLKFSNEKERNKKKEQPIESDKFLSEELVSLKKAVDTLLNIKEAEKEFTSELDKEIETIFRKQPEVNERIPVYNAGLVLYQPFLSSFFDNLGLLENRERFISIEHQIRAVHLLHHLSGFDSKADEHFLLFNKMLCGVNILFPISSEFIITEQEKTEVEKLTKALIRNWEIIKNTSVRGFQESFVKRKGVLERSQNDWILRVETKGIDILLDDIPWNIHIIAFPWNDYFIHVDWSL